MNSPKYFVQKTILFVLLQLYKRENFIRNIFDVFLESAVSRRRNLRFYILGGLVSFSSHPVYVYFHLSLRGTSLNHLKIKFVAGEIQFAEMPVSDFSGCTYAERTIIPFDGGEKNFIYIFFMYVSFFQMLLYIIVNITQMEYRGLSEIIFFRYRKCTFQNLKASRIRPNEHVVYSAVYSRNIPIQNEYIMRFYYKNIPYRTKIKFVFHLFLV